MSRRRTVEAKARSAFELLPEGVRTGVKRRVAQARGLDQLKRNQAALALRVADLERRVVGEQPPTQVEDDRFPHGVRSRVCTQAEVEQPWFAECCEAIGEVPRRHRKLWEHAALVKAADDLGLLHAGSRALGFGVGTEPLVAYFAGRGCTVLATDLDPSDSGARVWSHTGQHAESLAGLARPELCPPDEFAERVTWRPLDMRAVDDDLDGFDFCWSACSLEHLGSLDAGLDFVRASLRTLRPGGIALHTTEYNVSSNDATIETGHTVLYRRRDIESFVAELERDGHLVAALDFDTGSGVLDAYVDLPPYVDEPHLRLLHNGFVISSVALVIRTRAAE
jgi:SAM-dependent methyltransferase